MTKKATNALFSPFKPKKPRETGLETNRLRALKPRAGTYSSFSEKDKANPQGKAEVDQLITENLDTILKGYSGTAIVETKLDGYNAKLQVQDGIKLLSSGGMEYPLDLFPELEEDLKLLSTLGPQIYIGELHGIPLAGEKFDNIDEFSAIRKRGYLARSKERDQELIKEMAKNEPITLSLYDAYYSGGKNLLDVEMKERRDVLEQLIAKHNLHTIRLAPSEEMNEAEAIYQLFQSIANDGQEGLVIKNPYAPIKHSIKKGELHLPRTWDFIKMKKDLVLDLIVIGYMNTDFGREKGLMFTSLLCGVYNEETGRVETVAKTMGANSAKSEAYQEVVAQLTERRNQGIIRSGYKVGHPTIPEPALNVVYSSTLKGNKLPDAVIVNPLEYSFVVRVHGMEISKTIRNGSKGGVHSCGNTYETPEGCEVYAVRHPVLLGVHEDKVDNPKLAETTQQIRRLSS